MKAATVITLTATCPHCAFEGTRVPADPASVPDRDGFGFDHGYDGGRGGYVATCDSCGERFAIPVALARDAQHACLILLGED